MEKDNGVTIPQVEKPLPSNGKGTDIIKRGDDPFSLMDALDDKAIVAELEGRVVEKWVYHYNQDGQNVWGLSKVGVDAACREMAKLGEAIREISVDFVVDPIAGDHFLFTAKAARFVINKDGTEIELDSAFGTKRQALHHPKGAANKFWFEQGSMKALRNARQRLISEDVRAKIMALAKEKGKVKDVKPGTGYNKKETPPSPVPSKSEPNGNREQALGAIFEKLKGLGIPEKHQDRLLCKVAEHLGNGPAKVIKDVKIEKMPEILTWLLQVKKKSEIPLNDFSSLYGEVIKEGNK